MSYELNTQNAWIKVSTDIPNDITVIHLSNAKDSCTCALLRKTLTMLTTLFEEPYGFPVTVYNVNLDIIGIANNKEEYLSIWNSDVDNQICGTLIGSVNPFSFILVKNQGPIPDNVFGDPVGVEEDSILDFDDEPIIDFDEEVILYQ